MKVIFTQHALLRMSLRMITTEMVQETLSNPQRTGTGYKKRLLAFKAFSGGTVKVVYSVDSERAVVISVMWE